MSEEMTVNMVAIIQNMLNDQYDLKSILKELIQNADDAEAKNIHIGWMADWPHNIHPLLCSDALVVLNDGKFQKEDKEGIYSLGSGYKAGKENAIGKFGFGLKSIFHICEGFFFMVLNENYEEKKTAKLVTPWFNAGIHKKWLKGIDQVEKCLIERIEKWNHGCEKWFCLIIPLRNENQLNGNPPLLKKYFTKDEGLEALLPTQTWKDVASYVPLLRHVESIGIWKWDKGELLNEQNININFGQRTSIENISNQPNKIYGIIKRYTGNDDKSLLVFTGMERNIKNHLNEYINRDEWPMKGYTINGKYRYEKEKAKPHCAVVISILPAQHMDKASLTIKHAVFIPLSNTLYETELVGRHDFQILIHGCFFLDAGRKKIVDLEKNSIESQWNKKLEGAAWELLLPSLEKFYKNIKPKKNNDASKLDIFNHLIDALERSDIVKDKETSIYCDKQLISALLEDGKLDWKLLNLNTKVFYLPKPEEQEHFGVFRDLSIICKEHDITFSNIPKLTNRQPDKWSDHNNLLLRMLNSMPSDVFTNKKYCFYIIEFLKSNEEYKTVESNYQVFYLFIKKIKEVLKENRNNIIAECFRIFINLINKALGDSCVISLKNNSLPQNLYEKILEIDIKKLLLPDILCPENVGKLDIDETAQFFKCLELQTETDKHIIGSIGKQLFSVTTSTFNEKLTTLKSYKVFLARNIREDKEYLFNLSELLNFKNQNRLFRGGAGGSPFAKPMQKALLSIDLFQLVESEGLDPLLEAPAFNNQACFTILSKTPQLSPPSERIDILQKILPHIVSDNEIKGIRYLLHSSEGHYHHINNYLFIETTGIDSGKMWSNIAGKALKRMNEEWRFVPKELSGMISDHTLGSLNIKRIYSDTVEELLLQCNTVDWLSKIPLDDPERISLLLKIRQPDLWCQLPLHVTIDNRKISIVNDENIYFSSFSDIETPSNLTGNIKIINRTTNPYLNSRYENTLKPWNQEQFLFLLCDQQDPSQYWRQILDVIIKLPDIAEKNEIKKKSKESSWLPTSSGPRSINKLINIDNVQQLINLSNEICYFFKEQIDDNVTQHDNFHIVENHIFPSPDESLSNLGQYLKDFPEYALGEVSELAESLENLERFLNIIQGDADIVDFLPVIKVFSHLLQMEFDLKSIKKHIIQYIIKPIPTERIIGCLNILSRKHEHTHSEDVLIVHNWYLKLFAASQDADNFLKDLKLLNQNGNWKSSTELCTEASGISNSDVLNKKQEQILSNIIIRNVGKTFNKHLKAMQPVDLRNYFSGWEGMQIEPAIGGFLALLGDIPQETKELAKDYLLQHYISDFRNRIEWQILTEPPNAGVAIPVGMDEDIHKAMKQQEIKFKKIMNASTTHIQNLVGNFFEANIQEDCSSLIIGRSYQQPPIPGHRISTIQIRSIKPEGHTRQELLDILKESAREITQMVYNRMPNNINDIWNDLAQLDQLELEITQSRILENCFFYLNLVGKHHLPSLQKQLRKLNNMQRRKTQIEHAIEQNHIETQQALQEQFEAVNKDIKEKKEEIKNAIETDIDVQRDFLNALRKKISEEYQYSVDSIPFELFQNADDALAEAKNMFGPDNIRKQIEIRYENGRLIFVHWGRRINEYRGGNLTTEEGQSRGYNADLENMLILSSSDKSANSEVDVTGKFGLGFKSVFLICNQPKVLSGELGFEIVGGIYPKSLSNNEKDRLRRYATENDSNKATVFELSQDIKNCGLERFRSLLPFLLVFSKQIKKAECVDKTFRWEEMQLSESIFWGQNPDLLHGKPARFLIIRAKNNAAILLGIGKSGIEELDREIPSFWVTAPTFEKCNLGFLVNGRFAIDIGRAQLARDSRQNIEIAENIGPSLKTAFQELYEKTKPDQWDQFKTALNIDQNIKRYSFWKSLFNLFVKRIFSERLEQSAIRNILLKMFHEDNRGINPLLKEKDVLPTELSGDYEVLTSYSNVIKMISGILDEEKDVFDAVREWDSFRTNVPFATAISESRVGRFLEKLLPDMNDKKKLFLKDAILWKLTEDRVSPENANDIGKVITRSFLERMKSDKNNEIRNETDDLKGYFNHLKFMTRRGEYRPSSELKIMAESLREGYNYDDNNLLDLDYDEYGIRFFEACRPKAFKFVVVAPVPIQNDSKIKKSINEIYDWWHENRADEISEYNGKLYFGGIFPVDGFDLSNLKNRVGWLKLFLYGMMQTLGRTTNEAGKNFVRLCDNQGWLEILAQRQNNNGKWLDALSQYIENQLNDIPFYQWIKLFFGLFVISRNLDEYVSSFKDVENINAPFQVNQIANPNINPFFQGGGPTAPPASRILGIGSWFIMRELVRNRLIENSHSYRHCYVPYRRVRRLIADLGGPQLENCTHEERSIRIYEFLAEHLGEKAALFELDFDIPLQLISQNNELWARFFQGQQMPEMDSDFEE